jgi:hypothetical protein
MYFSCERVMARDFIAAINKISQFFYFKKIKGIK